MLLEERQKGNHLVNFPVLALVVSGGHTHLYLAEQKGDSWSYEHVGHTRDDAGEAFDKSPSYSAWAILEVGHCLETRNPTAVTFAFEIASGPQGPRLCDDSRPR